MKRILYVCVVTAGVVGGLVWDDRGALSFVRSFDSRKHRSRWRMVLADH